MMHFVEQTFRRTLWVAALHTPVVVSFSYLLAQSKPFRGTTVVVSDDLGNTSARCSPRPEAAVVSACPTRR